MQRRRPRSITLPIVLLLIVSLVVPATAQAATTFAFATTNATADEAKWMEAFDAPSSAFADFDGDGNLEMVSHNDNKNVYVLSTQSPRVLAEFRPDYPSGWEARPISSPVVADVDNDGKLDIVVVTSSAHVCVYEHEGGFHFEKEWCKRMEGYHGTAAADAGAAVADVDGDGDLEIFSNTEQKGLFAFNADGSVRWSLDRWGGNAGPIAADIDRDGRIEVIFASDGGTITAVDGNAGHVEWTFYAGDHIWPASVPVSGSVGQLDSDSKLEYVFMARQATHTDDYQKNDFMMFALEHDGRLKWKVQPSWGNPLSYTHAILHDIDGDGRDEIFAQDWNTIGHKPGAWERLGPANVFAFESDGSLMWRTQVDNTWSNDDIGLADMDGDGGLEVVAVGRDSSGRDGMWYLDARTGQKEQHVRSEGWTVLRGPLVADLDGDGNVNLVMPINSGARGGGFRFYDTDSPCRVVYGGWTVDDPCRDGSAGGGGGGGDPGGDPGATFDARFTYKSGNEWWIQVDVDANEGVLAVDVSIDGGSWKALTLKDWGDWAASYHAPEGSILQFRATSTDGDTALSGCYRWTAGTATSCSGGGGGGDGSDGSFDATFTPKGGNEWWIQVDVDSSQTVNAVHVSIDGGSWKPLELKSWGDWAASYHAPEGSILKFRATSGSGSTDTSGCYRWTSGSATTCTGGGGDGGGGSTFDAAFTPRNGNEWWIQVKVEANQDVRAVDASIDGGSWKPLELKSWGDWAASHHAPSGSQVTFRATSASGATDTSGAYTWPVG